MAYRGSSLNRNTVAGNAKQLRALYNLICGWNTVVPIIVVFQNGMPLPLTVLQIKALGLDSCERLFKAWVIS